MSNTADSRSHSSPAVVGVGAFTEGLDPIAHLLPYLTPATRLAFVLIQHIDRTHPSLLTEALAAAGANPDIGQLAGELLRLSRHPSPESPAHVHRSAGIDPGQAEPSTQLAYDEQPQRTNEELATAEAQLRSANEAPMVLDDKLQADNSSSFVDIDGLQRLVAESRAARAEAERESSAKDGFIAILSHELRTPLASMLLNAQRLRDGHVVEGAELQRVGESLERATCLQVKLIDDLIDVSRLMAGTLTLSCCAVDLRAALQASIESLDPLIREKALVVELALEPTAAWIWADPVRVQQIVSNLLANAIKFTPRGGRLSVAVDAATADRTRLRVSDTGIGIDAGFLPLVFTRFSQRDSSIQRKYGGLGLGLALVRDLVELQGGTVEAQSAGLGHGATFSVTFPRQRVANPAHATSGDFHALDRPSRSTNYDALAGLRVLIIDDDLGTREAVSEVLRLTGAEVRLAASAAEGKSAIDGFNPQVILCDIAMPVEDGYTFMRKLRAGGSGASIPALALTALASQDDRRRALAAGFQLHLAKPIDIDRLRDAVLALSSMSAVPKC